MEGLLELTTCNSREMCLVISKVYETYINRISNALNSTLETISSITFTNSLCTNGLNKDCTTQTSMQLF